jgi:hypothetical protein
LSHGRRRVGEPKERGEEGKTKKALSPPTVPDMLIICLYSSPTLLPGPLEIPPIIIQFSD